MELLPLLSAIGEKFSEERKQTEQRRQHESAGVAILDQLEVVPRDYAGHPASAFSLQLQSEVPRRLEIVICSKRSALAPLDLRTVCR